MADQFFGITDTGKQRTNNEDTFIAQAAVNSNYIIACVIDGLGGYSGGEVAAELAREAILQRLANFSGEIIPLIIDAFNLANEKIWQEKQLNHEHHSMACVATLAIVDLERNQFYYVHVGDTRLYLLRDDSLVKITHDQSLVGFLEDSGRLTEKAAMDHPKRNEIDKALGFEHQNKNSDYMETGQSPFLPGDTLLLCSDGLTDMVDKAGIIQVLTGADSLKLKGGQLIDAANSNGGKDNITVVLVKNDKKPASHQPIMPSENSKTPPLPDPEKKPVEKEAAPKVKQPETIVKVKRSKGLVIFLCLVILTLTGVVFFQHLQIQKIDAPVPFTVADTTHKQRNPQEVKLQNAINNAKGNMLVLTDTAFTSPVIISQAIQINNDTLYIKSTGKVTLQSDTAYHGAAFSLASHCKRVVLDSLTFRSFDTGVAATNNALTLKNVRFPACKTPVSNAFVFGNSKYVNGSTHSVVFKTDSLPTK